MLVCVEGHYGHKLHLVTVVFQQGNERGSCFFPLPPLVSALSENSAWTCGLTIQCGGSAGRGAETLGHPPEGLQMFEHHVSVSLVDQCPAWSWSPRWMSRLVMRSSLRARI